jgi:hypothetical protein
MKLNLRDEIEKYLQASDTFSIVIFLNQLKQFVCGVAMSLGLTHAMWLIFESDCQTIVNVVINGCLYENEVLTIIL